MGFDPSVYGGKSNAFPDDVSARMPRILLDRVGRKPLPMGVVRSFPQAAPARPVHFVGDEEIAKCLG